MIIVEKQHEVLDTKGSSATIKLITLSVVCFLTWASFAKLDEIVRGPGKVVPSSKAQVIQSLEGGIVEEILVWEGKEVQKGDVLVRLSDARFEGSFREMEGEVVALQARLLRLEQELAYAEELTLPNDIWQKDELVARSEEQVFGARRAEYLVAQDSLASNIELQTKKVEMLVDLVAREIAPELDLLTARQAKADSQAQLDALRSEYTMTRSEQYSETVIEVNKLLAILDVREDQLKRTTLVAPTRGIVNEIMITTLGGVAPAGEPILELTPLDDDLRIEVKILPKDVAFLRQDMKATIKLSAYDYTIFGSLKGTVMHVSADTFEDTSVQNAPPYYRVLISVTAQALADAHRDIQIKPGMIADAELHVGEKSVLKYLLKPLFKTREAFREP